MDCSADLLGLVGTSAQTFYPRKTLDDAADAAPGNPNGAIWMHPQGNSAEMAW